MGRSTAGISGGMISVMDIEDERGRRRLRCAAMILGVMLAVCGFFADGRIFCEAKEDDAEKEVVSFVTAYQMAQSPEKLETLGDYVDNPESSDFQADLLRMRATYKHGVKGWENIKVVVCPMSDGKHWIASVSSDMIIEGFDVGMPGLWVVLVGRNEKGELKIVLDGESEFSEAFLDEMRGLALSDEIVDHTNEITMSFNKLIEERPDMLEWVMETDSAVGKEVGELLAQEDALSVKADSGEEVPDAGKGSYTVKKGDCLWNIAEEQLGDGTFWSSLYEKNRDVIGEDPDLLYVGIILQMG